MDSELLVELLDPTGSLMKQFRIPLDAGGELILSANTAFPITLRARVVQTIELGHVELRHRRYLIKES